MASLDCMEHGLTDRANSAFEQGDFRQAIYFWSLALVDKQAHPAVILANRSAAYAHLNCWREARCDAEQAVLLQPDSVKALYRLARAQYHLQHMQQCVHTCTVALHIKPNAKQLLWLLRQAKENLRAGFLSERHHEASSAAQQAISAAAEQVQLGHWQQALQQQSSQDRSSAARHRRLTDAVEKEQFMQWNRNACNGCASLPISHGNDVVSAEDDACSVLNIKSGLPLADIRDAYISSIKKTHPDKGGSADQFCKAQAAFNYLTKVAAKPHH